jgi:hypothetical protein
MHETGLQITGFLSDGKINGGPDPDIFPVRFVLLLFVNLSAGSPAE